MVARKAPREWPCVNCGITTQVNTPSMAQAVIKRGRAWCSVACRDARRYDNVRRGEQAPGWKGDAANDVTKRQRAANARKWGTCVKCGRPGHDRHHKDGDPGNNVPENLEVVCRRCHMHEDGRAERLARLGAENARRVGAERRAMDYRCTHCDDYVPVGKRFRGLCHACNEYQRRHGGALPSPEVLTKRLETRARALGQVPAEEGATP